MVDYNIEPYSGKGYGPPNMAAELYKMISGLPDAYQEGVEQKFKRGQMARTEELQKPIDTTDLASGLKEYIRRAGGEGFEKLYPALQGQQSNEAIFRMLGGGGQPSQGNGANDTNRLIGNTGGRRVETDTAPQLGSEPEEGTVNPRTIGRQPQNLTGPTMEEPGKGPTVRKLAEASGVDPDTPGFEDQFRAIGLDRPLQGSQVEGAQAKIDNLRQAGMFGPTASLGTGVGPGPQPPPIAPRPVQTVQAQMPRAAIGAPPVPSTPVGTEAEAKFYEDRGQKRLAVSGIFGASPKAAEAAQKAAEQDFARAKAIREKLAEYGAPTTAQKEAPPGMSVQEAAAQAETLKGLASAKTKNVAGRIEGIKPAQDTIQVLDEMENALRQGWNNISTGAGARQWLDVKKAVNNLMPGTFSNVAEAETVDKLNAQLAAAAAKAMTARPSQLEFKAFMQNNPGLLTSKEGSVGLIDLMRQAKRQELDLGQLADRFDPRQGKSWSEIESKYYRDRPIISPFTHMPVDAKKAPDGKWYRPDPDRPGRSLEVRAR